LSKSESETSIFSSISSLHFSSAIGRFDQQKADFKIDNFFEALNGFEF